MVRVPSEEHGSWSDSDLAFFDVRTGVQLREIHPAFQDGELARGFSVPESHARVIMKSGTVLLPGPSVDPSKVVTILGLKQRKLDGVVAEAVLDRVRVVRNILSGFLQASENAREEEKFWLAQQVLTIMSKFSGRELAELEEIVEWFRTRPTKPR